MANQTFSITGGLDREWDMPKVNEGFTVKAPEGLRSYDAFVWVLERYGETARVVECLGCNNCRHEFLIVPKMDGR